MIKAIKFFSIFLICQQIGAQTIGFEEGIPESIRTTNKNELTISSNYYKDGQKSMAWDFKPQSVLDFSIDPIVLDEGKEKNYGITLWIYNEKPQNDSLRFEFVDAAGKVSYWFTYQLKYEGWRACWIGFQHMKGDKLQKEIESYRIIAPNRKGRVYIDRLVFPVTRINQRTTPDKQMPYNNSMTYRDLWHWCRVWQWEQYQYDIPLLTSLTQKQTDDLQLIEQRVNEYIGCEPYSDKQIKTAYQVLKKANIRKGKKSYTGAPVVAPDEINRKAGEMSWNDLETMLAGFAYDAYFNRSEEALNNYFTVWDYAMNQGFAYGSGMGTNHHYGYQVRKIYTTAWLMREHIYNHALKDDILNTLEFWSALPETRLTYQYGRDELLDTWHTLLMAKTIAAMIQPDIHQRDRAIRGLSRWVSSSLTFTPGTIGGIKVDGTTFHHGGFYPAYTTGALATLGQYCAFTGGTEYGVSREGRQVLKSALEAMRNYSNLHEWGTGIGGRHPFRGGMKKDDIEAFGLLALAGDLSKADQELDQGLAADYLRLLHDKTTELSTFFQSKGIKAAKAPEGFFVYNYGAAGVFRRDNWMVTLKGYNTDVWSSEIYTKDNRYGRYQSYGSVQIMGKSAPNSRRVNGFTEEGWNWNRLPGTTTIHLPFELLDSPLPGTMMAHSKENFAGSSSLEGQNGVFAMKLMERNFKNFTADFVARKSVFCLGNRLIFLGSDISNSNAEYPTETTLFQTVDNKKAILDMDGFWLHDGYDNYYHVVEGNCKVNCGEQISRHEKTRQETRGAFASAWIDHAHSPQKQGYEYMVLIQPVKEQLAAFQVDKAYQVLRRDSVAHVVYDSLTDIYAYAAFECYRPDNDPLIAELPEETIVIWRKGKTDIIMSVCDPNLNIEEKAYTTRQPSRPIQKTIRLKGEYDLENGSDNVSLTSHSGNTEIVIQCQHGQPVEFVLKHI